MSAIDTFFATVKLGLDTQWMKDKPHEADSFVNVS